VLFDGVSETFGSYCGSVIEIDTACDAGEAAF